MTIKIDKNIVGYSIKKPDEAEPAPKATHELMHEEIKRPGAQRLHLQNQDAFV